jgi:HNH endonuclease
VAFLFLEEKVTKEEVVAAILACNEKLGHVPRAMELWKHAGLNRREVKRHFGTYRRALDECKLEGNNCGRKVEMESLFRDWAGVARKLKKIPTLFEYEEMSKYSARPLRNRFGGWARIPEAMKLYAEAQGLAAGWEDVLELVERQAGRQVPGRKTFGFPTRKAMEDRPMYGTLLQGCPLVFAPTNEAGVLYLFGALSAMLGFLVLRIQTEFPDCEAMRVVGENRLQRVKIEFEHESRNFLKHMHEPTGCDLIVCWEHNWPECPLEVVELKEIAKIAKIG